jgi:hypothetical protein
MTVRWGVLSTARINENFLAGVAESVSCEVAAVASRDGGRDGGRACAPARGREAARGRATVAID